MGATRTTYTITLDDDPVVHKTIASAMGVNSLPYTSTVTLLRRVDRYKPMALFVDVHLGPADCGLDAVPQFRPAWLFVPILACLVEAKGLVVPKDEIKRRVWGGFESKCKRTGQKDL